MANKQINTYRAANGTDYKGLELKVKFCLEYQHLVCLIFEFIKEQECNEQLNKPVKQINKNNLIESFDNTLWLHGYGFFETVDTSKANLQYIDSIIQKYFHEIWEDKINKSFN